MLILWFKCPYSCHYRTLDGDLNSTVIKGFVHSLWCPLLLVLLWLGLLRELVLWGLGINHLVLALAPCTVPEMGRPRTKPLSPVLNAPQASPGSLLTISHKESSLISLSFLLYFLFSLLHLLFDKIRTPCSLSSPSKPKAVSQIINSINSEKSMR